MKKIGFFEEEMNVRSMTRLMSFLALITAIGLTFISVLKCKDANLELIITFLAFSGGTKITQKWAENKNIEPLKTDLK